MVADVDGKKPGVLIPIPQYPLYSASLAEFNMQQVSTMQICYCYNIT